ncbi:antibiotic biosynthesis monooxygenase [Paenibacillus sp. FSL R7-0273]|uniref:putative quinol monooxygenase n=1 Tax=Paenibacillus sp. FSL R7-0273 TaxID=1536772 RepID=UPI0004F8F46C|nr:antibiotic biosynthesis monooxygenase [Paenibacillus sp. FSL R7-0273]AIQ49938.1 antibiotic biosynthesis monooxygenase [Paenibacillus sp. FSL R7-0273]OMF84516.1 antibiotic biosynthesis monooxygenase [Paenibacillus sp. FSL R7-0273]
MSKFGIYAKFTAKPGERDTLAAILLESAAAAEAVAECELYIINHSETEPDVLWVTEVWSSQEAHAASLTLEATRAAIQRAMPLIAGVEPTRLRPIGGKGLSFSNGE